MKKHMKIATPFLTLALLLAGTQHASAASVSRPLLVQSATISPTCFLSVPTNLNFGSYDPLVANKTAPKDTTGSILINCTSGLPLLVSIDQGPDGNCAAGNGRRLRSSTGSSFLNFLLFVDAARNNPWNYGGGTCGGDQHSHTIPASQELNLIVYARIPANQKTAIAASYAQSLVVKLVF